jgi:hypothetical protein
MANQSPKMRKSHQSNQVVVDWLESIGGIKLVKFIGQEYAKELENISLFDLQESMGQQESMQAIIDKMESEEEAKLGRAEVKATKPIYNNRKNQNNQNRRKQFEERICYFCKEIGNDKYKTHDTKFCRLRDKNKSKPNQKSKTYKVEVENSSDPNSSEQESDDETKLSNLLSKMKEDLD